MDKGGCDDSGMGIDDNLLAKRPQVDEEDM